jgi:hypothetical protein
MLNAAECSIDALARASFCCVPVEPRLRCSDDKPNLLGLPAAEVGVAQMITRLPLEVETAEAGVSELKRLRELLGALLLAPR